MDKMKRISELIDEMEKISGVEKCLTCQCFYDTLIEFMQFLKKERGLKDMGNRLLQIKEKLKVNHNCLGCDPCLPVPVSNTL